MLFLLIHFIFAIFRSKDTRFFNYLCHPDSKDSLVNLSIEWKNYKDMKRNRFVWMWVIGLSVACMMCHVQPKVDHDAERARCEELFEKEFLSRGQLLLQGDFSESGLLSEEGICYKGVVLFPDGLALCEIKGERQGKSWHYEPRAPQPFFDQEAVLPLAHFDIEEAVLLLRGYLQDPSGRVKVMDDLTVGDVRVCMLHKFGYGDAADAYLVSLPDGRATLCITQAPKGPLFMERFYDFARQEMSGMEEIGKSKVSLLEITEGNNALRPTCQPTP